MRRAIFDLLGPLVIGAIMNRIAPQYLPLFLFVGALYFTEECVYFLSKTQNGRSVLLAFRRKAGKLMSYIVVAAIGGSLSMAYWWGIQKIFAETSVNKIFHARLHTVITFKYPGVLLYVYNSKFGTLLAPVGYAAVMQVTNTGPSLTKIQSYTLDIEVGGEWIRLPNLQPINLEAFYFAGNGDLTKARQIDFRTNSFDVQARDKHLNTGESIKGWMFFEWPPELREAVPKINKTRLELENSVGDRMSTLVDTQPASSGDSILGGGEWIVGPKVDVDLSAYQIMPHSDLLKGFRDDATR